MCGGPALSTDSTPPQRLMFSSFWGTTAPTDPTTERFWVEHNDNRGWKHRQCAPIFE